VRAIDALAAVEFGPHLPLGFLALPYSCWVLLASRIAAKLEWGVLYWILADHRGRVAKEHVRESFDGEPTTPIAS
jgi:hypothetical protein